MRQELIISVSRKGTLSFVDDPRLQSLKRHGDARTTRASHVLPRNPVLKVFFRWLRDRFGERGKMASFTRLWPIIWEADLTPSNGPILSPFYTRANAIAAEVRWLNVHNFGRSNGACIQNRIKE